MTVTVVGLDPSLTAAGIAAIAHPQHAGTPNVPRLVSVGTSGEKGATLPERSMRVEAQAVRIIKAMPASVRLVLVEALPMSIPNPAASSLYQERAALLHRVVGWLTQHRIPVVDVNVGTVKKFATGNGRADKDQMIAAMRSLWPHASVRDDNQADALALATIGAQRLGWFEPELVHHYAPNVRWPQGVRA